MKTIHQDRYGRLIGEMVKLRKDKKMTQTQLAQQLGKPQSYVAKIETLERKLDIVEFVDWCNAIGQSPSELLRAQLEAE
ncbi:MAG: helix-turn-helix transcriptional regulator [Pseudomonadota bacterium]|nr:helix-turn-helix transcriptional regulator [Pseudomonadota bacterium]